MMYQRNMTTGLTAPQQNFQSFLGDALEDFASDGDSDPALQQLHQIALQIIAQRNAVNAQLNNVSNADAEVDWNAMNASLQQIVALKTQFQQVAAQRAADNPYALSTFDSAILSIGDWAQGVLAALPAALAAIPNAIVNALGKIASNAGSTALGAAIPFGVIALGVIGLVMVAEKSPTIRKALP